MFSFMYVRKLIFNFTARVQHICRQHARLLRVVHATAGSTGGGVNDTLFNAAVPNVLLHVLLT